MPTDLSAAIEAAEAARPHTGKTVTVVLGRRLVNTRGYADIVPGLLIRANVGDEIVATVTNKLPSPTDSRFPTRAPTGHTLHRGQRAAASSSVVIPAVWSIPTIWSTAESPMLQALSPPNPGRIRLRIIDAGADTAFRVALAGHRMTVTHTDGFPVEPVGVDALLIGMAERYDVIVAAGDGVFPLAPWPRGRMRWPALR